MSDHQISSIGTPASAASDGEGKPASSGKSDTGGQGYLGGKYKTDADLEKGYKELQAQLTKVSQEKVQREKEAEELRFKSSLVNELKEVLRPQQSVEEARAAMLERLESEDSASAILELNEMAYNGVQETIKSALDAQKAEIEALKDEIRRSRFESDPVYTQHQEQIKALEELGISRDLAVKAVKEGLVGGMPSGATPPGETGSRSGGGYEPKRDPEGADAIRILRSMGRFTEEELANAK
jgi:hypothetical protein